MSVGQGVRFTKQTSKLPASAKTYLSAIGHWAKPADFTRRVLPVSLHLASPEAGYGTRYCC